LKRNQFFGVMSEFKQFTERLGGLPKQLKKMLVRQIIVALTLFAVLGFFSSIASGVSILIGFLSVILGVIIALPFAKINIKGQAAGQVIINVIKAELIKLATIFVVLYLAFKFYGDIQPFSLVLGLAISALLSGLAISKLDNN
jgi:ATP synthase protein I